MKWLMAFGILIFAVFAGASAAQEVTDWSELTGHALPAIVTVMSANEEGGENTPLGSGFIISGDGKIVTNFSVIAGKNKLLARRSDGSFLAIKGFISADADKDLIILKAEGNNLPFVSFGDSDKVQLGEAVCVIASQPSATGQISTGIVSAVRELKGELRALQITAPVAKESIGAPVFNKKAEVVGVADVYSLGDGQVVGIAIPSNVVRQLLKQAKAEVQPLSGDSFGPFALAAAQADLDKIYKEAIQTPRAGEDEFIRALIRIAQSMAKAGQTDRVLATFNMALQFSQKISDKDLQSWAMTEIAIGLARVGQFDKALQVAERIWIPPQFDRQSYAYAEIAIAMARAGQYDQALQVTKKTSDASLRSYGLSSIVEAMAEAGERERALNISDQALPLAKSIKDEKERSSALAEVAIAMAKTGQFDKALQIAKDVSDKYLARNSYALSGIIKEMAKVGQFDRAQQIAKGIKDGKFRASALVGIVEGMAKAGQFDKAIEVSQLIKDGDKAIQKRSLGLSCIAAAMAKAEQPDRAEQTYSLALQAAQGIKNETIREATLWVIAQDIAKTGQFDKALQVAQGIKGNTSASYAYSGIAQAMAMAGQFDQALQIAQKVSDAGITSNALSEVATAMANAGQFDASLKVAQTIDDPLTRLDTLAGIINAIKSQKQQ
jgi:serine protease Do